MENNSQAQTEVIEIDLFEVIGLLWSRLAVILLSGVLGALALFLISFYLLEPQYESETKLYVINRQNSESLTYNDLQSGTQLTKDYKELVTSRPVVEEVISELSLNLTVEDMVKKVTVETPTDTRILTIIVEDPDPYVARNIANAIRVSASAHISRVMDIEAVNVVEEANLPEEPASPNILLNVLIGVIAGIFLSIGFIVIIYMMDDTVKNPDEVERFLHCSVLASIPESQSVDTQKNGKHVKSGKGTRKKAQKPAKRSQHENIAEGA